MSIEYQLLKKSARLLHLQKLMALPYDQLMRLFGTKRRIPVIPCVDEPDLKGSICMIGSSPVLLIRHVHKSDALCIYVIGGGMLKYPGTWQVSEVIHLARKTGRDFALPYFPIRPEHDLFDALDMLDETYKLMLEMYAPKKTAFLGGSSGAYMTLCLISIINVRKENLPMPGKVYLS